jgi:hypothetical protein
MYHLSIHQAWRLGQEQWRLVIFAEALVEV